jgi:hypothetical protein
LNAFWNKFGVLTGFVGSGWSKKNGFEKEDQSEDGCMCVNELMTVNDGEDVVQKPCPSLVFSTRSLDTQ